MDPEISSVFHFGFLCHLEAAFSPLTSISNMHFALDFMGRNSAYNVTLERIKISKR